MANEEYCFDDLCANKPKLIDDKYFVLGVNLAWLDGQYDHDFGSNGIMNDLDQQNKLFDLQKEPGHAYNPNNYKAYFGHEDTNGNYQENLKASINLESYFNNIQGLGISVVRIWVFERFEGLSFDKLDGENEETVKTIYKDLLTNLKSVCKLAKQSNLRLYLALIDSWGLWREDKFQDDAKKELAKRMAKLIKDPTQTRRFVENAVIPLICDSEIKDAIFAVDIFNEPEGLVEGKGQGYSGLSWDDVVGYIDRCSEAIHEECSDIRLSCGLQKWKSLEKIKGCQGLNFFDFHEYSDSGEIPKYSELKIKIPVTLGECGQKTERWDDDLQQNVVDAFLENTYKKGYAGCIVWNYDYPFKEKEPGHWLALVKSDGSIRKAGDTIKKYADICKNKNINAPWVA